MEGPRESLRGRRRPPDEFWCHAPKVRVWTVMRTYVEVMVIDAVARIAGTTREVARGLAML